MSIGKEIKNRNINIFIEKWIITFFYTVHDLFYTFL